MTPRIFLAVAFVVSSTIACAAASSTPDGHHDAGSGDDNDDSTRGKDSGSATPATPDATPDAAPTTPTIDAGTLSTCANPRALGSIKGDVNGPSVAAKGSCSEWLQVRATEESSAGDPMRLKVSLVPDSTIDFDLYLYRGANADQVECTTPSTNSSTAGTAIEVATLEWGENGVPNGADDARIITIEVRPKNPAACTQTVWDGGGYSNWTLLVEGNTSK